MSWAGNGWGGEGACVIPIPDNYSLRSELYDRSTEHIFKLSDIFFVNMLSAEDKLKLFKYIYDDLKV